MSIPNTGADIGTWGSADLNPNFGILDNILGSVTTLNLAGAGTVNLTDAQQQSAIIRLTGVLTTNPVVAFSEPGFWIIENLTSGNFVVTLSTPTSVENIATPPGSRYQVFCDPTIPGMRFVNLPPLGTLQRFCTSVIPTWITACTINPWLPCRGGTQLIATYPALAAQLGTTFGGNGSTTFGVPDFQGRDGYDLDNGAGRISSLTMSPSGNTVGATGGDERFFAHTHGFTGSPATWATNQSNITFGSPLSVTGPGVSGVTPSGGFGQATVTITPSGNNSTTGTGAGQNMPPSIVAGITFIKT
jgi:microcystin-dependent protein